jgi:mannose-6-phosphate isomerase-like protein (cupin superfamily)
MKLVKLQDMTKGWFIGDFEPSIFKSPDFEVAVKEYQAGDKEDWHLHKLAKEITVILSGKAKMANMDLSHGDIIMLDPGEGTNFEAITDVTTVVVKSPSIMNDKYLKEDL